MRHGPRMRYIVGALFVSATLGACAGDVDIATEDEAADEIRRGQLDSAHPNVIRVNSCSATLIAPRTILSAAHCFYSRTGALSLQIQPNIAPINASYVTTGTTALPDHDLAVLTLDTAVTGIEPALMLRSGAPVVGEAVTFVGFGKSAYGVADWRRRAGSSTLSEVHAFNLVTRGAAPDRASIDSGDSGGPAFVIRGGRERLAGVASLAKNDCSFSSTDTCTISEHARTDVDLAWIQDQMKEPLYDGVNYDRTPMPKFLTCIDIAGVYSLPAGKPAQITISAWAPAPSGRFILRIDGVVVHQYMVKSEQVLYWPTLTVSAGNHTLAVHVYDANDKYIGGRTIPITVY